MSLARLLPALRGSVLNTKYVLAELSFQRRIRMPFADKRRKYALCRERLTQRRNLVVRTLDYLNDERKIVKTNRTWKSPVTQRKRSDLLDEIQGWYDAELKKINEVLERMNEQRTGFEKNTRRANSRRLA
jgi:hypothetical protein